jgi:hypothetical protein
MRSKSFIPLMGHLFSKCLSKRAHWGHTVASA